MMGSFKPMLAAEYVLGQWDYSQSHLLVSPKLNGVRGANQHGSLLARSLKLIPNHHTRAKFGGTGLHGCEGELVVGPYDDEEVFTASTSGVMSIDGKPDVSWYLFDMYHPTWPLEQRIRALHQVWDSQGLEDVGVVPYFTVVSDEQLQELANTALAEGYEGLVLRHPNAVYKQGRSTASEGGFMRFCPWFRSEATILEVLEGYVNTNESKKNELGYLKKSLSKAGMVGSGRAGSIAVKDTKTGICFNMPVPTVKLQEEMWAHQGLFVGKICKYKFKPAVNIGGKPRFPQWEGLRHPDDMS